MSTNQLNVIQETIKLFAMDEQDLLELKQKINKATTKVAELNGQKKVLMTQLKEKYGVSSLEKAQEKVKSLEKEIKVLDNQIDTATEKLEKQLDETKDSTTEE